MKKDDRIAALEARVASLEEQVKRLVTTAREVQAQANRLENALPVSGAAL